MINCDTLNVTIKAIKAKSPNRPKCPPNVTKTLIKLKVMTNVIKLSSASLKIRDFYVFVIFADMVGA